jgi:hypothetical protein
LAASAGYLSRRDHRQRSINYRAGCQQSKRDVAQPDIGWVKPWLAAALSNGAPGAEKLGK